MVYGKAEKATEVLLKQGMGGAESVAGEVPEVAPEVGQVSGSV